MAETYYSLTDIVKLCDNLVAAMPTSFYSGIMAVRTWLANIPAADVVPVRHGRWERKADPYGFFDTISVCSVCDCTTKWREEYLYCPNCGARMDGDSE